MFSFLKSSGPKVERIDPAEAVTRCRKGEMVVIDVRDINELKASGLAKGAIHIPMMLIATKADPKSGECDKRLKLDKPVALYCASGARSNAAAKQLLAMGYERVYNIGGLGDWRAGGGVVNPA